MLNRILCDKNSYDKGRVCSVIIMSETSFCILNTCLET